MKKLMPNNVGEFLQATEGKFMNDPRPDAPPAHWSGVAAVIGLFITASQSPDWRIQLASIVGATVLGLGLLWRDAHVRKSRNETEQAKHSGHDLVVLEAEEPEDDDDDD